MPQRYGTRVGVFLSGKEFLGFGVYVGDLNPMSVDEADRPVGTLAEMASEEMGASWKNPCLKLDSGDTVWGCESWWCSEEKAKQFIAKGADIVTVSIRNVRNEWRQNQTTSKS